MSKILRPEEKTRHFSDVKRFMQLAKQEMHDTPTMPSQETRLLRARLILEEALETVGALGFTPTLVGVARSDPMGQPATTVQVVSIAGLQLEHDRKPDLEGIADGCADLSVVNIGTLIACGIADAELLRQVDENNIRKFRHICPKCGREYTEADVRAGTCAFQPKAGKIAAPGMMTCAGHDGCGTAWRSGYRREDGKWIKPDGHEPPPIAEVLEAQGDAV